MVPVSVVQKGPKGHTNLHRPNQSSPKFEEATH